MTTIVHRTIRATRIHPQACGGWRGCRLALLMGLGLVWFAELAMADNVATVETETVRLAVSSDARVVELIDRQSGENCVAGEGGACAWVRKANQLLPATSLSVAGSASGVCSSAIRDLRPSCA